MIHIENIDEILKEVDISDMNIEIWKSINYPDSKYDYQISNYGRFRNKTTGNIIKPYYSISENFDGSLRIGYYRAVIHLKNTDIPMKLLIHRLVGKMFVHNPNPRVLVEIDHKDANRFNNHYTNLEWVTPRENIQRSIDMKLRKPRCGSDNPSSIWTEKEVKFIWNLMSSGMDYKEVYSEYSAMFENPKDLNRLKNLFYNLKSKSNPKWTQITSAR